MKYKLPINYTRLTRVQRKEVREQYILQQRHQCYWCHEDLRNPAPDVITAQKINLKLFPPGFLNNPIHLQHNHENGQTEGAVHAYCNAVMWEHHGR